jgi:hypothetical protein
VLVQDAPLPPVGEDAAVNTPLKDYVFALRSVRDATAEEIGQLAAQLLLDDGMTRPVLLAFAQELAGNVPELVNALLAWDGE